MVKEIRVVHGSRRGRSASDYDFDVSPVSGHPAFAPHEGIIRLRRAAEESDLGREHLKASYRRYLEHSQRAYKEHWDSLLTKDTVVFLTHSESTCPTISVLIEAAHIYLRHKTVTESKHS